MYNSIPARPSFWLRIRRGSTGIARETVRLPCTPRKIHRYPFVFLRSRYFPGSRNRERSREINKVSEIRRYGAKCALHPRRAYTCRSETTLLPSLLYTYTRKYLRGYRIPTPHTNTYSRDASNGRANKMQI